ncbi:hypothetical protein [Niastella vici]|uniref:hypothetical protein n=1 Tax=Niastella vici TaxID=1703345 RepID=UPI00117E6DC1|nr:hypothetical protein [Niastella vici]
MNKLKFHLMLVCVFAVSSVTYAQEQSYSIGNNTDVLSDFRKKKFPGQCIYQPGMPRRVKLLFNLI